MVESIQSAQGIPYDAIKIGTDATSSFKVNGSRLKHYISSEPIEGKVSYDLLDASFT